MALAKNFGVLLVALHVAVTQSVNQSASVGFTVQSETSLREQLLENYSTSVRPKATTQVNMSFNLVSINYVDMRNEQFSVSGWWSLKWTDDRLSWHNTTWQDIPVMQVFPDKVWTPSLVVDNSVEDLSAISEDTIPIRVRSDGEVTWNPPGIIVTSCDMALTYFPFDTQTCSLSVTSVGYTIQELDLAIKDSGVSLRYFSENGEWSLLDTTYERTEYEEDDYTYSKVTFNFDLERRPVYYGLNTMLPVLVNSLLIPLVFMMPNESGEKVGFCLTSLLAYVVILTLVTQDLPTSAKTTSLLGVYIAIVLIMAGVSVFLAICSLHLHHRSDEVPAWLVRLTNSASSLCRSRQRVHPAKDLAASANAYEGQDHGKNLSQQQDALSQTSQDEEVTWTKVASTFDTFFFYLYTAAIMSTSLGFALVLVTKSL